MRCYGTGEPVSEHDRQQLELFRQYLTRKLTLEEYEAACARLEGTKATQEGIEDGGRSD